MNTKCLLTIVLVMASRLLLFAQSDVTNELITNPGFENGINNGWSLVVTEGAASFADAGSSESVSGNSAGKVEVTTTPSGGSAVLKIYLENELKDATAYVGKTITYSFKAKSSWTYAGSSLSKIMARVDDQSGNNLASNEKWFTGSNEDVYQDVAVTVNVPSGTTQLRFYIWLGAYKASYTLDDFTVTCAECQGSSKIDQTISFSSLSDKTEGDPSFDLSATASSTLAVTYSSSNTNVATISGSTVTVVGDGTTTITASQAGNATYNAAPNVTQNLTVNAVTTPPDGGDLTKYEAEDATKSGDISFNQGWRMDNPSNGDCAYFNDDNGSSLEFTVNVATAGTYDLGFVYSTVSASSLSKLVVNGQEVETIAWPYTGGGFTTTLNYDTNVSLNAGNNTIKVVHEAGWLCMDYMGGEGSGEVDPDPNEPSSQVITFNGLSNKCDTDAAFNLTASASSGLTVSYTSSNTNVATISNTNKVTIVGKGTTTITASQAGNTDFHPATNKTQSFTVTDCSTPPPSGFWAKQLKGVNEDASIQKGANFEKVQHERAHMETIADAGFESVRFFVAYASADFTAHEQRIRDALDHDLAVIMCMWGPMNWYGSSNAENEIADRWTAIAQWVETTFPGENEIGFELLNETGAIGFPQTAAGHLKSMKLYGAAANAVRAVSTTRPIMISPSGWQDADLMDYVTVQNVGYDFTNDPQCGMSIHFYKPSSGSIGWFAMNEYPLINPSSDEWRKQVRDEVDHVLSWRTAKGVPNMPIVVTEWGCWSFPEREERGDLKLVVDYHMDYFKLHGIGSTWYTGIQNNQRAFAIFDSEIGWNDVVVKGITGQNAPATWPSTNQFLGSEFEDWGSNTWKKLNGGSHSRVQFEEALSGNSSLVLTAPTTIYQRSFVGKVSDNVEVGENLETRLGKYLLHLIQGKTYKISFLARAEGGNATLKFRMKENLSSASGQTINNQTGTTYFTSSTQTIGTTAQKYEITYTHNSATAWDVWAEFELISGSIIFDAVDFRQAGGTNSNSRQNSNDLGLEKALEEMLVYPNPSSHMVNLMNLKEGASLQIINAVGKVILSEKVKSNKMTIDVSQLNKGIYFIRSASSISKLIVE